MEERYEREFGLEIQRDNDEVCDRDECSECVNAHEHGRIFCGNCGRPV